MASINYMNWAKEKENQIRVKYYMQKSAIAIIGESFGGAGEPTEAQHAFRKTYSDNILNGSASVYAFAIGVTTNASIAGKIDAYENVESDLEFVVNSLINDFAGVE